MAKVTNPLLSMVASGQIGKSIVFDKRGRARIYVIPANPQSVDQMAVRNTLGDLQRGLKLIGAVLRAELRSQFGAQWNSMIIGELMANNNGTLDAYVAEHTAFDAGQKTAWAGADGGSYVLLTDGAVLYALASAVYDMGVRLGATLSLTQPAAANAVTVGAEWIDSTP